MDNPLAFVIDCDGNLMKCWAELGNKPHIVGSLQEPESWGKLVPGPLETRDPFDDGECLRCSLLPVCMGACPILRHSRRQDGIKVCPPYKGRFEGVIRATHGSGHRVSRWTGLAGAAVPNSDETGAE